MQELTLEELKDRLVTQFDPEDLIELLNIKMRDMVEAFEDKIELYYNKLMGELG